MKFSLDDIVELKHLIKDKFNIKLHFHDCCGGQYFSVDKSDKKILNFVKDYFAKKAIEVEFSHDEKSFFKKES